MHLSLFDCRLRGPVGYVHSVFIWNFVCVTLSVTSNQTFILCIESWVAQTVTAIFRGQVEAPPFWSAMLEGASRASKPL